jgi:hypothetical protein
MFTISLLNLIFTAVALLILALCAIYYCVRSHIAANSSGALAYFAMAAYLQQPENRAAREIVAGLTAATYDQWKNDKHKMQAAQDVAMAFDITAAAMKNRLVNPKMFAAPWQTEICKSYLAIRDFIIDRQKEDKMYVSHYVGLARYFGREAFAEEKAFTSDSQPNGVKF